MAFGENMKTCRLEVLDDSYKEKAKKGSVENLALREI